MRPSAPIWRREILLGTTAEIWRSAAAGTGPVSMPLGYTALRIFILYDVEEA